MAVREDERSKNIGVVSLGALAKAQEHTYASGYVAALRDAVEAVKVSLSADIELVERSQVIADIEALGGER